MCLFGVHEVVSMSGSFCTPHQSLDHSSLSETGVPLGARALLRFLGLGAGGVQYTTGTQPVTDVIRVTKTQL